MRYPPIRRVVHLAITNGPCLTAWSVSFGGCGGKQLHCFVSVHLARHGGSPMAGVAATSDTFLTCEGVAVLSSSADSNSTLRCRLPDGYGGKWTVVLVNHDSANSTLGSPGTFSPLHAQASGSSPARRPYFSFDAPRIYSVEMPLGAPAIGGFPVVVQGDDFTTTANATIDGQRCAVGMNAVNHTTMICTAPPLRLVDSTPVGLVVQADDLTSTAAAFAYDAPVISGGTNTHLLHV